MMIGTRLLTSCRPIARNDGRRSGKAETHVLEIGILVTIASFGVADFLITSRITVRLVAAHRDWLMFGGLFFLTGGAQFFSFQMTRTVHVRVLSYTGTPSKRSSGHC